MPEETLVIVKPDGMQRNLAPEIISRIENAGLAIEEQKDIFITYEQAERLYAEHKGKLFFEGIVEYMMSDKVKVMRVKGENACAAMRQLMGETDPFKAAEGTIRGDFRQKYPGSKIIMNTVHGSDSPESAKREIGIFFG